MMIMRKRGKKKPFGAEVVIVEALCVVAVEGAVQEDLQRQRMKMVRYVWRKVAEEDIDIEAEAEDEDAVEDAVSGDELDGKRWWEEEE